MRLNVILAVLAVVCLSAAIGLTSTSASETKPEAAPAAVVPQDQDAMIAAMMAAAAPGEMHKKMLENVGEWTADSTVFMGQDATKSKGTATITALLGGRFMQIHEKGEMFGQPTEGYVIVGYDNISKQFQSFSISTMGTGIYGCEGTCKDNVTTYTGLMRDVMSPVTPRPYRLVVTQRSKDQIEMEIFDTVPAEMANDETPAGAEIKIMNVIYNRKK